MQPAEALQESAPITSSVPSPTVHLQRRAGVRVSLGKLGNNQHAFMPRRWSMCGACLLAEG